MAHSVLILTNLPDPFPATALPPALTAMLGAHWPGRVFTLTSNDPDLHFVTRESTGELRTLKIEDVRDLHQQLAQPPYQEERSLYLIEYIERASIPAQNALLKILEEPPEYTQLILTAASRDNVLPTVLSRCRVIQSSQQRHEKQSESAEKLSELTTAWNTLLSGNAHELFALSQTYSDRDKAHTLMSELIEYGHRTQLRQPTIASVSLIQRLQEGLSLLEKNVNVRLVVEGVFQKNHAS